MVATHKPYQMPLDDIYLPIHVGAEGKNSIGFTPDNTGDNISFKNKNYCELTGLYWFSKNMTCDYMGVSHYRRYFVAQKNKDKWQRIATRKNIEKMLQTNDIILPKKRDYFIETTYSQYAHAHHAVDLDVTRQILVENYLEYVPAFDATMKRTKGHKFNMFIMKKEIVDAYCDWLFDVLFELENRLDISGYNDNDARVFGFVSERLLDVWLETNKLAYAELPVVFMEKQNWIIKGFYFIKRKFSVNKKEPAYI